MRRLLTSCILLLSLAFNGSPSVITPQAPAVAQTSVVFETHYSTFPAQAQEYITDELPQGERQVLCEGTDGLAAITETVTLQNGIEVSRQVDSWQTIQPKIDRLVLVGAGDNPRVQDRIAAAHSFLTPAGETVQYSRVLHCIATAYSCEGYTGTTAIGTVARVGAIAVDPAVIPYGTEMYIISDDGEYIYGYATAEDCGNFRGYQIDLYFDTVDECWQFGARGCTVYILG